MQTPEERFQQQVQEQRWLERALQGDGEAAGRLLEPYRARIQKLLAPKVRTPQDAEDLTQEVFRAAYASLEQYRQEGTLSGWLMAIARNHLCNYYRRMRQRQDRLTPLAVEGEESAPTVPPADPAPCLQERVEQKLYVSRLLAAAQACCSQPEYAVLLLVYQDVAREEIARFLKLSPEQIRQHFLRGRQKLLAYLARQEPDMLGGQQALEAAWERACACQAEADRPTPEERAAWAEPDGRARLYRAALMKAARYLGMASLLARLRGDQDRWI
jgi:RNA polymerase sigma-70 factor (ECF subfamily)